MQAKNAYNAFSLLLTGCLATLFGELPERLLASGG